MMEGSAATDAPAGPPASGGRASWLLWAYALPALALMTLVSAVPIIQTFYLSGGFQRIPTDGRLWASLGNTATFTAVSVGLELVFGLGMALLLHQAFPGRGLARAAVLLPWALPTAIMAMGWRWIFNSDYGVMGDLLCRLGIVSDPHIPWLASPGYAMAACVLADVWKTAPFMAVLFLSGLAAIPRELYEAAVMDGAGPVRRFFLVTWPLLKPTVAVAVIFRAIQAFGVFDLVWVLTGGGPGGRTQTIALYIYDTVFRYLDLSYGCALTVVMAACLAAMAGSVLWVLRPRFA